MQAIGNQYEMMTWQLYNGGHYWVWRCVGPQGDIDEPTKICGSTDENKCKVGGKNYNPAYTCQWVRNKCWCAPEPGCPKGSGERQNYKCRLSGKTGQCYADCVKEFSDAHLEGSAEPWCINP